MVPGQAHAQHVHGDSSLERDFTCPTQDADANGDGIVNTLEGILVRRDPHRPDDSGRRHAGIRPWRSTGSRSPARTAP